MTRALWIELAVLTVLGAILAAWVPLYAGMWSWSWDALNHHVYLGYIAEHPRWELDVVAASVQSWQYPYLYWPVYRLSLLEISGATAGAIWSAGLAALLLPPLWVLSWRLLDRAGLPKAQAVFERTMACALGASSIVLLAGLNTTANDPLATLPLLWALAVTAGSRPSDLQAAAAGALWGVATAFKLSSILALPLLLLWWWVDQRPYFPFRRGIGIAGGAVAGFLLAYAPWGWQLWQVTGSPFHPMIPGSFGM